MKRLPEYTFYNVDKWTPFGDALNKLQEKNQQKQQPDQGNAV